MVRNMVKNDNKMFMIRKYFFQLNKIEGEY